LSCWVICRFFKWDAWDWWWLYRIPLLNLLGYDLISAFVINLFTIPFSSFIGAKSHFENLGTNNSSFSFRWVLGSIIGTKLGSTISLKTKPRALEISLLIIVLILASILLIKTIFLTKKIIKIKNIYTVYFLEEEYLSKFAICIV
jgi:uncharacterized membrane protein YfcA